MTFPNSLSSDLSYPSSSVPLINENVELIPVAHLIFFFFFKNKKSKITLTDSLEKFLFLG